MGASLTDIAVVQYLDSVKHEFQTMQSTLADCVTTWYQTGSKELKVPTMAKGEAVERGAPSSDLTPINIQNELLTIPMINVYAMDYIDRFDNAEVNISTMTHYSKVIASALHRKKDQIIITDGLVADANLLGTVVNGGTGLTIDKIQEAGYLMDDEEVPEEGRYMAISAKAIQQLLSDPKASSSDYSTVKTLMNGGIAQFYGFTMKKIGTRAEGGLPVAANIRDCFAWHKDALAVGINMDIGLEMKEIPQKFSYQLLGYLKMGAIPRTTSYDKGIVKIQIDETA